MKPSLTQLLVPASVVDIRVHMQVNDTIMLDIETGKPKDFVRFELGNLCMVTGGANNGYVLS